ncbi:hypothetical protein M378DRAFT_175306 [Amanita muscaria Koide BX008]|uniref:Translin n=1 Tax=Amanita muscaria (strain Koide BX008) TaxID=946122 RepID=A0A0C2XPD1_AMAMK|nr:hypothetical protein M378DRAFT_175306 [Amanita muscaria Koide BX008]
MTDMDSATSPILEAFETFRVELDDYNDRRERLIKASRDATNLSKKVIFLLHRVVGEASAHEPAVGKRAAQRGREKLREVQNLFAKMSTELKGDRYWRYRWQVSPGIQEYTEALSFAHYLEHGTLITLKQVEESLSDTSGIPYFPMSASDYLLGVSDLMGELMRYAISSMSKRGGRQKAAEIGAFVRNCKADFEMFTPNVRDLRKKQFVTGQSLEKIEDANYAVVVRCSEFDLPPEMLDDIVSQTVSTVHGGGVDAASK